MERTSFGKLVTDLALFFERNPPKRETLEQWWESVFAIPEAAVRYIRDKIQLLEAWPKNIPAAMWKFLQEWRTTQPYEPPHDANACHHGFFEVCKYQLDSGQWAIWQIPCRCKVQGGARGRLDLLGHDRLKDEPDRYQSKAPPWGLIYPDKDSLEKMSGFHDLVACETAAEMKLNQATLNDGIPF